MVHSNKSKYPPGGYGRFFLGAVAVFAAAALFWMTFSSGPAPRSFSVEVAEPELSSLAAAGKVLYEANCAICHGIRYKPHRM